MLVAFRKRKVFLKKLHVAHQEAVVVNFIPKFMSDKKNVVVLCTRNSCRSQMAHGYLNYFAKDYANVYSAGVETHGLNPGAIMIMKDDDIDISNHTSNHVDEYTAISFDYVITVCDHANEICPVFPGGTVRLHHNFKDPAKATGTEEEIMQSFREARDKIKVYFQDFANKNFTDQ